MERAPLLGPRNDPNRETWKLWCSDNRTNDIALLKYGLYCE